MLHKKKKRKKSLTEEWHFMEGMMLTGHLCGHFKNVPYLDCLVFSYQIVFCWSDNHVLHMYLYTGTPDVPSQNRYYWPCTRTFPLHSVFRPKLFKCCVLLLLPISCFSCSCCIFIGNENTALSDVHHHHVIIFASFRNKYQKGRDGPSL